MILSGEQIFLKKTESQAWPLKQNNLPPVNNKIYYGCSIGFNFWNDYFYISASPWIGYKISQNLYAHSAFVYSSYERIKSFNINQQTYETERIWIPFLMVGAGYTQSIRKNICL